VICSSLCRVPFTAVLLSWIWENSHSRRSSFRGLGQIQQVRDLLIAVFELGLWDCRAEASREERHLEVNYELASRSRHIQGNLTF